MTDVKRYLQQIRLFDSHINAKLEELNHLKEMVTKITPTLKDDVVSGGGSQDKLADAVAKIVDLEAEIDREVDRYVDARNAVTSTIDKVTDERQHKILSQRYVQGKTFEKIASDMNYTYRWVCIMHGRALQTVEKILKSEKSSF